MIKHLVLLASATLSFPTFAATLDLPANARVAVQTTAAETDIAIPIGAWSDGALPTSRTTGTVQKSAWHIDVPHLTTSQILAPLREQLLAEGFEIIMDCDTDACGGFDFRFNAEVIDEPNMHINLGDFRALTAQRGTGDDIETVYLIASKSVTTGFLQWVSVTPNGKDAATDIVVSTKTPVVAYSDFGHEIETNGHAILGDLEFQTGSSSLGDLDFDSLGQLADYLNANPNRRVALVGHTDAEGSLAGNIGLSKKRAQSVAHRLTKVHGVAAGQLEAEGMGYLSPRASNLTDEGRAQNRRVEVILTSTQ